MPLLTIFELQNWTERSTMNNNEEHCVRSRQPTLPPFSNRTLHHPSFLPQYMAAGFAHHHVDCYNQTVHPIIPAEFFYTDPTMISGERIPNIVSELRVFECFQLNTPPPVMSACLAPPTRPDPFRSGPHATRDLGSLTLKITTLHPPVDPVQVIVQLTQAEDQAITNLLTLHHQEPLQSDESLTVLQVDLSSVDLNPISFPHSELVDSASAEEAYKPCSDVSYPREASVQSQLQQGRCWLDTELEAAKILMCRFSPMEEVKKEIWGQNHNKSAVTLPDPLPYQHHKDSSISTESQQGSETLPALITTDGAQNNISYISCSCARENGEPGWVARRNAHDAHLPVCESSLSSPSKAKCRLSAAGDFPAVKEQMLSDSEGVAVHVLLSLREIGALDIVQ